MSADRSRATGTEPVSQYPPANQERRIVPFRRNIGYRPPPAASGPVKDLAEYHDIHDDGPDEYRHRMKMNGLAALVLIVLMVTGWWIADRIVNLRKDQDCALSGRRNCETIHVPPPQPAGLPSP